MRLDRVGESILSLGVREAQKVPTNKFGLAGEQPGVTNDPGKSNPSKWQFTRMNPQLPTK
jgi:hypothetical protein